MWAVVKEGIENEENFIYILVWNFLLFVAGLSDIVFIEILHR